MDTAQQGNSILLERCILHPQKYAHIGRSMVGACAGRRFAPISFVTLFSRTVICARVIMLLCRIAILYESSNPVRDKDSVVIPSAQVISAGHSHYEQGDVVGYVCSLDRHLVTFFVNNRQVQISFCITFLDVSEICLGC